MDLVGEHFLAVPEQRDQDVLDDLLDEVLDVESIRKILARLLEFQDDGIGLDVRVPLDQLLDILETVHRRLAEGGIIDTLEVFLLHQRCDGVLELVHQAQGVGDEVPQF